MANTKTTSAQTALDPGQRSPERRKRSLLDSAILEFSTYGIGGARVDRIAQRARTNKAMVYHYFGSKEDLYLAAMEDLYSGIREAEERLDLDPADPVGAMKALISFTFRYYIDNPAFIRMINTENLHGAVHLQAATGNMAGLNSSIVNKVSKIVESGVAQGIFRRVDPLDLYISISALGFTYVSNRHTLKILFGRELLAEDAVEARLSTITEMIMRYLAADGHHHLAIDR
ncbi:transcriptional regulator, TetR family [Rhizobium sp. NFR07]|uniref:TetR family transcriptional regulator n=1 Tax=Rhizobium sp. NFR07 TaxID=1566262 RepID=UPI0008E2E68E|nr:TetR family transcriptional regulator [Rhizobium sp. NFR07]SFB30592.1 transcriptional regulator, TetR family [Rhizobium sp. NFR07]